MNVVSKPVEFFFLCCIAACAIFARPEGLQAAPFHSAVNLGATINTSAIDDQPVISDDGLRMFFSSNRPGGFGGRDVWLAQRPTVNNPFAAPVNLGVIINDGSDNDPGTESSNGLRFYLNKGNNFFLASRASTAVPWSSPTVTLSTSPFANLGGQMFHPAVSNDELTLVYQLNNAGSVNTSALMLSTRANVSTPFDAPVALTALNVFDFRNVHPSFSGDDLSIYFASNRPASIGDADIYRAVRSSTAVAWTSPSVILEHDLGINTAARETGPFAFGNTLYFSSDRLGTFGAVDLYAAVPEPGSAALLAMGGFALGLLVIRRKRRVAPCRKNRA